MSEAERRTQPPATRRLAAGLALAALAASAVVGSGAFGLREVLFGSAVPEPVAPAGGRAAGASPSPGVPETVLRSVPWWQDVARFSGSADEITEPFDISEDTLQWRARWICTEGRFEIALPGTEELLVDAFCPDSGTAYVTEPGETTLEISASASWTVEVAQQIDAPLVEPPLDAMVAPGARVVARSALYGIERTGTGDMIVYRLPGGGYALRLENVYVTPNIDLELRFSELARPRSTAEFLDARSTFVAPMPVTAGSLNFRVPRAVDPLKFGSLVVWCPPLSIAYAGATIEQRGDG